MELNIADALIQSYAYNTMTNEDDTKVMSGGYRIQSLVDNHQYTIQSGGSAHTQRGYNLHLDNMAIPIGLVYQAEPETHRDIEYVGGKLDLDDAGVIPTDLYDKLLNQVSVPVPKSAYPTTNKTRKN